ncbi:glycoside hydrolase family 172 protein [Streptomyces sp. NPDC003753]|uniref:glycoside hydrolase family 172 protein n=1 Tax=Streptomyces sp. NPDC058960 TaxID=3346679 RepID=UPI00367E1563
MPSQPFTLGEDLLGRATKRRRVRTARVSSWDHSGGNEGAFFVMPGETAVLADLEGPGALTHLWFVQACRRVLGPSLIDPRDNGCAMLELNNALGVNWEINDPDFYRKVIIRMYWDDQETPSVVAPLGDFFCLGHSMAANFQSLPFTVSVRDNQNLKFGGSAAFNCYLPMPFNSRARVEVENQNDVAYVQYYYIDYELYPEELPDDTLYFHAHWRRENPTKGWGPDLQVNSPEVQVPNLDGKDNYVILETEGAGNYIGCNHSVAHLTGTWWGEGSDMIFVDDDTWPPSYVGTGGEDYFSQGWGMQPNSYPFAGSIIQEDQVPGYQVSYRWHLPDMIRFDKRIKVTLQHGHANHLQDDWASTAYWYQTLPSPRLDILPVEQRLPRRWQTPPTDGVTIPDRALLDDVHREMYERRDARMRDFLAKREEWLNRRAAQSREWAAENKLIARDLRRRFLEDSR